VEKAGSRPWQTRIVPAKDAANPWLASRGNRGADYDARFARLAETGVDIHGEADLVWSLLADGHGAVLDAGCGTGRVAIELARRGATVTGVDLDPTMLAAARTKAGKLDWVEADLADPLLDLGHRYDIVVAAGNVLVFLTPGTESAAVATMARHLVPGGRLVAGFQLGPPGQAGPPGRLSLDDYDRFCGEAGLTRQDRWATWGRSPWQDGGDYAVSVHRSAP
jgi:SAM-dependent methyltransferase